MHINTKEILPIFALEGNCLLGRNGDVTYAFELQLPEIYSLAAKDYERMHEEIIRFFTMFTRCVVHRQDIYQKRTFCGEKLGGEGFLQKATRKRFEGRPYLEHRSYLYLSRGIQESLKTTYLNCKLVRAGKEFHADRQLRAEFQKEVDRAVTLLNTSGYFRLIPMESGQIEGVVQGYLNGNEQDCLTDIAFRPDFKIGDRYVQLYSIQSAANLPSEISPCLQDERLSSEGYLFYKGFLSLLGWISFATTPSIAWCFWTIARPFRKWSTKNKNNTGPWPDFRWKTKYTANGWSPSWKKCVPERSFGYAGCICMSCCWKKTGMSLPLSTSRLLQPGSPVVSHPTIQPTAIMCITTSVEFPEMPDPCRGRRLF